MQQFLSLDFARAMHLSRRAQSSVPASGSRAIRPGANPGRADGPAVDRTPCIRTDRATDAAIRFSFINPHAIERQAKRQLADDFDPGRGRS
jgi:hypothetical protein